MMSVREIYRQFSPAKVRNLRGDRPRRVISEMANKEISESEIAAYESGVYRPSDTKMLKLLQALGCVYNDISDPVLAETRLCVPASSFESAR